MVPQVVTVEELKRIGERVARIHASVEADYGVTVPLKFGSMIEVVRACLRATRMAETAEFFSFGTNDLTQATFSFSREDAENKFLRWRSARAAHGGRRFRSASAASTAAIRRRSASAITPG